MSTQWLPIQYRDFYDVPRLLAFEHAGHWYVLDNPFNDAIDDYGTDYTVLRVRDDDVADLANPDWRDIVGRAHVVGVVPVTNVRFDPTKRLSIERSIADMLDE